MRFFLQCSYDGTPFQGWQKQPGKRTIQDTLEKSLQILIKDPELELIGCGRTDTGVHAMNYYAHFDAAQNIQPELIYHLNAILPPEIAVQKIIQMDQESHARFNAVSRTYQYYLHGVKSPFLINKSFFYKQFDQLDIHTLNQAAQILLNYSAFYTFCLSKSGVKNYEVNLKAISWKSLDDGSMVFSITANRFLRGMVRLIVGMCIQVSAGLLELSVVKDSLEKQTYLPKSWSVPPHGLYLTQIDYPYSDALLN